jgi:hypothetical protein
MLLPLLLLLLFLPLLLLLLSLLLLQSRQCLGPVTWLLQPYEVTAVPLLRQPHSMRAWRLLHKLLMPYFLLLLLLLLLGQGWQLQSCTVAVPDCASVDVIITMAAAVDRAQVPCP